MDVIFIDSINNSKIYKLEKLGGILPRKGDQITWVYNPPPVVTGVIWDIESETIYVALN